MALLEAGAYAAALALLDRLRANHPHHLVDWIAEDRARCLVGLGRNEEAIDTYQAAITASLHRRGSAPIGYAALVDRLDRADLFETALTHLTDFWDAEPTFPATEFEQFGWTAILLNRLGHAADAVPPARRALAAARKQRSNAANHPHLGLVTDRHDALKHRLQRIVAGASPDRV